MDQYWQDTGEAWQSMAYRWKDKHDELVEKIKQVHHEIKGIRPARCRVGFIGEYQV
jgi:hypothetical protein